MGAFIVILHTVLTMVVLALAILAGRIPNNPWDAFMWVCFGISLCSWLYTVLNATR